MSSRVVSAIKNQQEGRVMGTEANKMLVRHYVELYNTGDVALADEVIALDFVDYTHPELRSGPEDVKNEVTSFRAAFPDARITVEDIISEGDTVAFRFVLRGTHQGMFAGFPATAASNGSFRVPVPRTSARSPRLRRLGPAVRCTSRRPGCPGC